MKIEKYFHFFNNNDIIFKGDFLWKDYKNI